MSEYQQASLMTPVFRHNGYYSGHCSISQSFLPVKDEPGEKIEENASKEHDKAGPSRPEPPKTPFMCFARYKEDEMARHRQPGNAESSDKVFQVSKEWKAISSKERAHWNEVARQDKIRYDEERKTYTGWSIPKRRAKKHPLAPKRPMSAFLRYSKTRRKIVKEQNPDMSNTDVSRLLGEMWHNAPPFDRDPYIAQEIDERMTYKVDIAKWKSDYEKEILAKTSPDTVAGPTDEFNHHSANGAPSGYRYSGNNPRYDPAPEYTVDGWEPYGLYNAAAHQRGPTGYPRCEENEHYHPGYSAVMIHRNTHPSSYHTSSAGISRHDAVPTAMAQPPYAEHHRMRATSPLPRGPPGNEAVYYHQSRAHHNEIIPYPMNDSSSSRLTRHFLS